MGVNWNEMTNPETIPYLRFVPTIALPTVFGDALSYMEQVGKINAVLNGTIENMNNLAQDIIKNVTESLKEAKIPVYGVLEYTQSLSNNPSNWNLENPDALRVAILQGKLCILEAKCYFNEYGQPVYDADKQQYFVLTQVYTENPNNYTEITHCTFMNYDENCYRYVTLDITRTNNVVTAETTNLKETAFPSMETVEVVKEFSNNKVLIYKGTPHLTDVGEYLEISENCIGVDLADKFILRSSTEAFDVPSSAPCVVVDYYTGIVGQLRYGGNATPWARLYNTGIKLSHQTAIRLAYLQSAYDGLEARVDIDEGDIGALTDRVADDEILIQQNADNLEIALEERVSINPQTLNDASQAQARANIDAAQQHNPYLIGTVTFEEGGATVNMTPDKYNSVTYLLFEGVYPIIRGVRTPEASQDVATKGYVDSVNPDISNCVQYVAQTKSDLLKEVARQNIGAAAAQDPVLYGAVSIQGSSKVVILQALSTDGYKILNLGGSYGNTIIRNVAEPVNDNDAANKEYVDKTIVDASNTVKYVPQNLTSPQKAVARGNIDALPVEEPECVDSLEILGADANTRPTVKLNDLALTGTREIRTDSNGDFALVNGNDDTLVPIKVGSGVHNANAVRMDFLLDKLAPINISLNFATNQWSNNYSYTFDVMVNNYRNGKCLMIEYRPTVESDSVYFTPKCASYSYIIGEVFDGNNWQRVTLNNNGSFAVVQL